MSRPAERTTVIPPIPDEEGFLVVDRDRAEEVVGDLLHTLIAVGGKVEIIADRVKIGEIPGARGPEPLAETVGFVVAWRTIPQLHDESLTLRLMRLAQGDDGHEHEPDDVAADLASAGEPGEE